MAAIGYMAIIPAGLITLSVWWVRHEDSSFNAGRRTCQIQVQSKLPDARGTPVTVEQIDPTLKMNFERYGATPDAAPNLGRDVVFRPIGERAERSTDWLAAQESRRQAAQTAEQPGKIANYQETSPPADPLETALSTGSGYDIVADEATKIEMGKNRVVFTGHVRMSSPQFYLTSDQLIIFLGKDKSSMNSAEAQGNVNVRLTSVPPERACRTQSGKALYNPAQDTLTLIDWPKIKSQSQEQIAATAETKMTIVTKTGKMTTQGKALTRVAKSFVAETTGGPAK
jgi:lipopolysaccharide transport protein LptA